MRPTGVSSVKLLVSALGGAAGILLFWISRFAALVVLTMYFPVFLLVGFLVALTPGPTCITRPYRRGAGEVVYLYEFRTECWQTYRETDVGRLLKSTGVYRLPRIVNVLLGHVDVGEPLQSIAS